ncbi:MAG: sensor histidine kinase, partial [Dehalococcoidia bacterium]
LVRGEARTLSVSATPLLETDGSVRGAVAILRDFTDWRRAQERAEQSERLRALGEMASGVAHDFNNLLGIILGRCELILGAAEVATRSERRRRNSDLHVDVIKQAALDGAETVKRLQSFSGVGHPVHEQATDLAEIVSDVIEFTRPRWKDAAQQQGHTIRVVTEIEPLPAIHASPAELREVLVNLIFNAVDAMPNGGAIGIRVQRHDREVWLQIQDTGIGMNETVRRRVFEPFFSTKGTPGAGLGLSVSYSIVTRMGGRLELESTPSTGTTFTVALPYRPVAVEPAIDRSPAAAHLAALVVDDEPSVRETTALLLQRDGHEVVRAAGGEEALALVLARRQEGEAPFDVIFTDLGMPGINGLQLIAALRDRGFTMPCVLITGWGVELADEDITAAGAQAVLAKPYSGAQLRQALLDVIDPGEQCVVS